MAPSFDAKPLKAFFQEVKEQLDIDLSYLPNDPRFPIQLSSEEGISRHKCVELLSFIKGQVDLRDNEIARIHPSKKAGKFLMDITSEATKALAEVYALSFFYDTEDEEDE